MLKNYENLLLPKSLKKTTELKKVNALFIEHFLNYSLEQYLSNSHLTEEQKKF